MPSDEEIARAAKARARRAELDSQDPHVQVILAQLREEFGPELPVGTRLRESETGEVETVIDGLLAGGGFYILRDERGNESRLHPAHIGGMFVVDEEATK